MQKEKEKEKERQTNLLSETSTFAFFDRGSFSSKASAFLLMPALGSEVGAGAGMEEADGEAVSSTTI